MRTTAPICATGLAAVLGALALAVPAQADTVGSNLAATPTALSVCNGSIGCTLAQTSLAPGRADLPIVKTAGVIVRWRVKSASTAPTSLALTVLRGDTAVAKSPPRPLAASGVVTFEETSPIPVEVGDRLGVDVGADNARIAAFPSGGAELDRWSPALGLNQPRARSDTRPFELLLNADVVDPSVPPPPPPPGSPPAGTTPPAAGTSTPVTSTPSTGQAPSTQSPTTRPSTPIDPAPRITALQFSAARISFRISEPASVSLLVQRVLPGKRVGARCLKPTSRRRAARKCNRLVRAVAGRTDVDAGVNTARLRRLPSGRYRVRLLSIDLAGRTSTIIRYFRVRS